MTDSAVTQSSSLDVPAAPEAAETPESAAEGLGPQDRVGLVPLSVVEQDDGFVVGNPAQGVFVKLPEIGVTAIEHLRNGHTIGQVSQSLSASQEPDSEDVDVLDFTHTLIELGFVAEINGIGIGTPTAGETDGRRWISGPRPEHIRWLFGRTAWTVYIVMFLFCLVTEISQPAYRTHASDFFFLSDPLISIAILTVVSFVLTGTHECFHWLAASAQGVAARFAISRRLYFLVFETDLTQMWSLPKRRRYGPLLAGMGFDATLLAITIVLRMMLNSGIVSAPPVVYRLLAAIGILLTMNVVWQFCIFLRNDLYLVVSLALGCVNLWRISMLGLKDRLWRLSDEEKTELASADERDRRHARWYGWLCVVGVAGAAWFAKTVVIPAVWHTIWSIWNHLDTSPPDSLRFGEGMVFGVLALLPNALTLYLIIRDTPIRRRTVRQPA